jgi:hypothetical protein
MRVNCPGSVSQYFLFVDTEQVESNIVSVGFNCIRKELKLEWSLAEVQVLEGKSKLSGHNQNFEHLVCSDVLLVVLQEF